jgi:type IV pilus assembly protein PilY1
MGLWTLFCLAGSAAWAIDDWQKPVMSDYVKTPPFISNSVKPNIMIILDNSGSMNEKAYAQNYTGEPYAGMKSFNVVSTQDDMEESASGVLRDGTASANDLDLGTDFIGIRFQNVSIPAGVTIEKAYIEFVADGDSAVGSVSELEIVGEASDDAGFLDVNDANNISDRPVTLASVKWNPHEFTHGETVVTEDITSIVQEIIDRSGWATGNAMLFRIGGINFPASATGHRQVESSESGTGLGPVLRVHYGTSDMTRYYGLFNPDYFYQMGSNTFEPLYKKSFYDYRNGYWYGESLAGGSRIIDDTLITTDQLWDGNWLNWVCMRRIDVLRKVLMGGRGTSRQGGGNHQKEGEPVKDWPYGRYFSTSGSGPAVSPHDGAYNYYIDDGDINVYTSNWSSNIAQYKIDVQKLESIEPEDFYEGETAGILQRIGDRARWGNMWFDSPDGGKFNATIDHLPAASMASDLQNQSCSGWTPLAETYYMAMQYFMQRDVQAGLNLGAIPITNSHTTDPYYDKDTKTWIECAKSFVILLTDGASTRDARIPDFLKDYDKDGDLTGCDESDGNPPCDYDSRGTDFLDDVALYARTTDLRPGVFDPKDVGPGLDGDQNLILYTIYAFSNDNNARSLLKDAARNGGFEDLNNNGLPDGGFTNPPQVNPEWDQNGDGNPDTYFEASDGYALQDQLLAAINDIFNRASSGTAASVISNSRAGEGAVFQSIFYPADGDPDGNTVEWMGKVQSLLVDSHGNLREDTLQNKKLDLADDLFIVYTDDPDNPIQKYKDANADGIFDLDEGADGNATHIVEKGGLKDIKFLWSSQDWLNELSDADVIQQRTYDVPGNRRYIFTFADRDKDMVADSGEVQDFVAAADPSWAAVNDAGRFEAYLHPYEPFGTPPVDPKNLDGTDNPNFASMVTRQARRIVNYVRGQDHSTDIAGGVLLPAFRSRKIDYDLDGQVETWRLGDIVYSTPTAVGRPSENYDLIYRDEGYSDFYRQYRYRRNVVYVGANDGMLHAFNAGFYDDKDKEWLTRPENGSDSISQPNGSQYIDFAIGSELWAYVPHNLLSHLHWLTDPDYAHVYYVDLQPRIFDAKIFPSTGTAGKYPNGWGTVLVGGMRFGGGKIAADIQKDGAAFDPATDRAMSSAYFILDITNPEEPPTLLAEVSFPNLGFTTCFPGVVPMRDFQNGHTENANQWYLFVGSGPIGDDPHYNAGDPDSAQYAAQRVALTDGTSDQQARLYAIDLTELVAGNSLQMATGSGLTPYSSGSPNDDYHLARLSEAESSISRPISIDWDLDFNVDVVYFGSSYGDHAGGWYGKMRRIVMNTDNGGPNPLSPATWITDSTLIEPVGPGKSGQPIMAPANAGVDKSGNRWVFFGTGRYFSTEDSFNTDQQSYYGLMEPYTLNGTLKLFDYSDTLTRNMLKDVTDIGVVEGGQTLTNYSGDFLDLANDIETNFDGWVMDFDYDPNGERNLGQAVLAGDLLTFTTYIPSGAECSIGGHSLAYVLYYRTGTAYPISVFGVDLNNEVLKRADLGMGLTITPNIHVGRQEGSKAYIQTSTGAIKPLEEKNPGTVKSGKMVWQPDDQKCP